ncbi:hypothetical protein RFI_39502 [Reticulomyxa filosa]|uniref:Pseudouridine synthase RsuA/RluA-like domain-containing protein n=1 Tax=Reticulomyxa filosa TaxID=46433 RepID=X6LA61_RETFI|nr:hypothetical protein RFI_39502 [Reticulomyxa filosa]|eukprot:ETN98021.1 hypothetical protein RFI_39502 [Reticulomyxa filosa]
MFRNVRYFGKFPCRQYFSTFSATNSTKSPTFSPVTAESECNHFTKLQCNITKKKMDNYMQRQAPSEDMVPLIDYLLHNTSIRVRFPTRDDLSSMEYPDYPLKHISIEWIQTPSHKKHSFHDDRSVITGIANNVLFSFVILFFFCYVVVTTYTSFVLLGNDQDVKETSTMHKDKEFSVLFALDRKTLSNWISEHNCYLNTHRIYESHFKVRVSDHIESRIPTNVIHHHVIDRIWRGLWPLWRETKKREQAGAESNTSDKHIKKNDPYGRQWKIKRKIWSELLATETHSLHGVDTPSKDNTKKNKVLQLSRGQIEKKLKRLPPEQYEQLTQQYEHLSSSFSSQCSHETLINALKHCVTPNKLVLKLPFQKLIDTSASEKYWSREELIIYEDEEIVVVNKPPGMSVHLPENNNKYQDNVLMNILLEMVPDLHRCIQNNALTLEQQAQMLPSHMNAFNFTMTPGLVHRMDRQASGLMVFGKSLLTIKELLDQWNNFNNNNLMRRECLVLCHGSFTPLQYADKIRYSLMQPNSLLTNCPNYITNKYGDDEIDELLIELGQYRSVVHT